MKKRFLSAGIVLPALLVGQSGNAALVIEESFDYAASSAIIGQGGGTGFSGNWTGVGTTANVVTGSGLSFGDLDVSGGAMYRDNRSSRGVSYRAISAGAQADLMTSGTTIWFSVLMDPTINTGANGGQTGNTYGTLIIGSENLTDSSIGSENGAGTDIASGGDGVGVGFFGSAAGFDQVGIQGVTFSGGTITQSNGGANSIVTGDVVSLIVGKIEWAAGGSNDIISLYNVTDSATSTFNPDSVPFSTMTLDVDQTAFDTISIADGQTSGFDEVRFGTELTDVLPGFSLIPEPSSVSLLALGVLSFSRRRRG